MTLYVALGYFDLVRSFVGSDPHPPAPFPRKRGKGKESEAGCARAAQGAAAPWNPVRGASRVWLQWLAVLLPHKKA